MADRPGERTAEMKIPPNKPPTKIPDPFEDDIVTPMADHAAEDASSKDEYDDIPFGKNILETALSLIAEGISVIPVQRNKKPAFDVLPKGKDGQGIWSPYQKRLPTEKEVNRWFGSGRYNIAVVCGPVSGNLINLDFDDKKTYTAWGAEYKDRLYYCYIERTGRGYHVFMRLTEAIESDSDHNGYEVSAVDRYTIIAPSVHSTGKTYTPIQGELVKLEPVEPELFGLDRQQRESEGKAEGWQDDLLDGVSDGERNITLAELAGRYVAKKLSRKESLGLLMDFDSKCKPPVGKKVVEDTLDSIIKTDKKNHPEEKKVIEPYPITSLEDLENAPPIEWLIEDVWFDHSLALVSGYAGFGKSLLGLAMAEAIAGGDSLFYKFKVNRKGPVLFVDEENSQSDLEDRVKKMRIKRKLSIGYISFENFYIDDNRCFDRLMMTIEKYEAIQVFFDSLVRIHKGHENDATDMAYIMGRFREIANTGVGVGIFHHHTKGFGSSLATRSRGSSDIVGAVDVEYALSKEKEDSIDLLLETVKSRRARIEPLKLRIMQDVEKTQLWIECLGTGQERREMTRTAIVDQLKEKPSMIEPFLLWLENDGKKMSRPTLQGHFSALVEKKILGVRKAEGTTNGKEYYVV